MSCPATMLMPLIEEAISLERCPTCGQADNCGDCNHRPTALEVEMEIVRMEREVRGQG